MNDVRERHADRYGKPLVSRRTARVLLALAVAAFVAVVLYVGIQAASTPVRSEVLSYEHLADDSIGVDFMVTMDPGTEASCRIQALNKGRAQVGFVETEIPAQEDRRTAHHVEISTQGDAVSAEVVSCSAR
ncbi:MAG: DUF4307 domain-containing protein [Brachybacterium sp.]|uniref:DUF4307 domain-containing protein n=1 Tax=unclassified Brachybacterium TaxID=2623841 RepID=UPI003F91F8E1